MSNKMLVRFEKVAGDLLSTGDYSVIGIAKPIDEDLTVDNSAVAIGGSLTDVMDLCATLVASVTENNKEALEYFLSLLDAAFNDDEEDCAHCDDFACTARKEPYVGDDNDNDKVVSIKDFFKD